jgi:hypothetical protein
VVVAVGMVGPGGHLVAREVRPVGPGGAGGAGGGRWAWWGRWVNKNPDFHSQGPCYYLHSNQRDVALSVPTTGTDLDYLIPKI